LPWVAVLGLGVWTPGFPDVHAYLGGATVPGAAQPTVELPPRLRRRASLLTRMMADVASQAARQARRSLGDVPLVMGSAFGELVTTMEMLEELETDRLLSPFRFHNSVHNTAVGYLGMAHDDQRPSTAIAAGNDTVPAALLDALAWLAERGGDVLVLVGDEPLPEALSNRSTPAMAGALWLRAGAVTGGEGTAAGGAPKSVHGAADAVSPLAWLGGLRQDAVNPAGPRPAEVDCPAASMLSLVKAVAEIAQTGGEARVALTAGDAPGWSARVASRPPPAGRHG
jgi:hypothetical protein